MTTLGDVACTKSSDLLKIRNIGEGIVAEITRVLADYGFEMGEKKKPAILDRFEESERVRE